MGSACFCVRGSGVVFFPPFFFWFVSECLSQRWAHVYYAMSKEQRVILRFSFVLVHRGAAVLEINLPISAVQRTVYFQTDCSFRQKLLTCGSDPEYFFWKKNPSFYLWKHQISPTYITALSCCTFSCCFSWPLGMDIVKTIMVASRQYTLQDML